LTYHWAHADSVDLPIVACEATIKSKPNELLFRMRVLVAWPCAAAVRSCSHKTQNQGFAAVLEPMNLGGNGFGEDAVQIAGHL
jgi:hypothetical protein